MYRVQPKGINIKDNDRNVEDGFLQESINLQWKDGTYKPIPFRLSTNIPNYASPTSSVQFPVLRTILHKVSDEDVINVLVFAQTPGDIDLFWLGKIENGVYTSLNLSRSIIGLPTITNLDSLSFTILNGLIYFMSSTDEFYYQLQYNEVDDNYEVTDMYDWKENYPIFLDRVYSETIPSGYISQVSGMLLMRYTFVLDTGEEVLHSPIYPFFARAFVPNTISIGDEISNIHTIISISLEFQETISDRIVGINVYATQIDSVTTYDDAANVSLENLKALSQNNMYLVTYLDINDVTTPNVAEIMIYIGEFTLNYFTGFRVDSNTLPARLLMPIDNFTHHKLFGKITNYNGRLIIDSPKVKMTNGNIKSAIVKGSASEWINIQNNFIAKTEDGNIKGQYELQYSGFVTKSTYRGIVSYPDYRGITVGINVLGSEGGYYKYNLTPFKSGNIAVSFKNIVFSSSGRLYETLLIYNPSESGQIDEGNSQYISNNRIQFSEAGEFSVWPVINSYRIGEGKILFVGSNSINPSDTDYISPLLVGTSDGIYTVNFDTTGSNLIQSITRAANLPALSENNILIDQSLIYVSDKGLIVINSGNIGYLTARYFPEYGDGNFPDNNTVFPNYNSLTSDLSGSDYKVSDIVEYMKGALLTYDGRRNNLWCCNPNESFSLIYNFETNQWSMSTYVFKEVVDFGGIISTVNGDVYSRFLVKNSDDYLDILSGENLTQKVQTHLLTRPIKFQSPDTFKKIQRLISRCELIRDNSSGNFKFGVWGKQDINKNKVNIPLVAYVDGTSQSFPNNVRQDIPIGRMKGKYKTITILQGGNLLPDSSLNIFEIVALPVDNKILR